MATRLKNVRIDEATINVIQKIADEDFEGNFTAALMDCALCGVSMRKIPVQYRDMMKAGANRTYPSFRDYYLDNTRVVVDALQI